MSEKPGRDRSAAFDQHPSDADLPESQPLANEQLAIRERHAPRSLASIASRIAQSLIARRPLQEAIIRASTARMRCSRSSFASILASFASGPGADARSTTMHSKREKLGDLFEAESHFLRGADEADSFRDRRSAPERMTGRPLGYLRRRACAATSARKMAPKIARWVSPESSSGIVRASQ